VLLYAIKALILDVLVVLKIKKGGQKMKYVMIGFCLLVSISISCGGGSN